MLDRVFELVFKYRPLVFTQGDLAFSPPWPAWLVVCAVLAAAAVACWLYGRDRQGAPARVRLFLLGLRVSALALLLFALLRPVLVLRAVEPQRNVLAVLIDDSRSLTIADRDGVPRHAFVEQAFGRDRALGAALAERFALRFFRFSSKAERMPGPEAARFDGTRSEIGLALQQTADELAGLPVSGIVLLTDGADTSRAPLAETLRRLRTANLPVFAVGLGQEQLARDVQIGRVDLPLHVLKGATLVVDVLVGQWGYAGTTVPVVVEDEGRVIATQDVVLPADGEPATARVQFTLSEAGPRVLTFRIPPQAGEQVAQNNQRQALVSVDDRRERVLYVEGEPRPEMKFLRQAVADDKNLQIVTLQRTASRKFLRLDIDSADELAGGFPKTRDELFAYRGLVLGSIEAAAFTPDQLRMIADFVSVRGGGVLALGGRQAFAEGGYAGTPVEEMLPVLFEASPAAESFVQETPVLPTRLGQTHVVTQIADTSAASAARWATLPPLTAVNPIRRAKPGAAVLLDGGAGSTLPQIVLAYQRYGAGKALALPVQDSWMWQMHADIPIEDMTHETLWRRLLRWLVDDVPDRLSVDADQDRVEPGDPVTLTATVRDGGYLGVNDAAVQATVVGPDGTGTSVPMGFVIDRDGVYQARFSAPAAGLYEVRVDATRAGQPAGSGRGYFRAAPDDGEFFDAAMRASLLTRVADDTGGRFYTPETVSSLPEEITYLGRGVTVIQEKDLWDMPVVLAALVTLVGGEWALRRRQGLP
ncbi:MAG: hypothetical protein Q7V01_02425 [Vicinamibacterales bacterium]|nr:hypothetical protein [Vicinamibacterales bacterium]